jgi:hypothetical protein
MTSSEANLILCQEDIARSGARGPCLPLGEV